MKRGSAAQVVLLPGGIVGQAVLDKAAVWSAEGLLDPVFWVPAELVREHHFMPARVSAIVFGRNESGVQEKREVPLLAALGRESIEELVVTSVRWLSDDEVDRDFVSAAAQRLLIAIKDAMPLPRQTQDGVAGGTTVRSLNVVFAATKVTSDEIAPLISTYWEENILVSPEDRQRPNAADRFTDADDVDTWAGFVAASTATLAGLWTGFSSSPVTKVTGTVSVSQVPKVRVARTFARAVVSGGFSIDLARSVAAALANPKTPLMDPVIASQISGVVALDGQAAQERLDEALRELLEADSGALTYRGVASVAPPAIQKVGFSRAIREFLSFSWDKFRLIPVWIWGWFADKLSRTTKETLYGVRSSTDVDARADLRIAEADPDLLDTALAIEQLQAQVQTVVNQPPLPVTRITAPTLWSHLRATVFSLVDGGSDSADVSPGVHQERVQVLPDVGMVIPSPWEIWKLPAEAARHLTGDENTETVVTWTDLGAARDLLEHLKERSADLEMRMQELEQKYVTSRKELITAERDFVEARELWEDVSANLDELEESHRIQGQLYLKPEELIRPVDVAEDMEDAETNDDDHMESGDDLEIGITPAEHIAQLNHQVDNQMESLQRAEQAVAIRRRRLDVNKEKLESIRVDVQVLSGARDSLGTWLQERSQSLALRLLDHVDNQAKLLDQDENDIRGWANQKIPTNVGRARELRRRFIRSLWVSFVLAILIPIGLGVLRGWLLTQDLEPRWWSMDQGWQYVVVGISIMVLGTLIGLISYFRGYQSMRDEMTNFLARGRYLLLAIERIRLERARLDGLAPQIRERLEFFGAVLQEPWRVPGFGGTNESSDRLTQGLPALLQIASTAKSDDPTAVKLRAQFTAEQYRVGMRRAAINDLIAMAAERQGIPREQAELKVIDRDASTYGLRSAIFGLVRDDELLEGLGRLKVAEVAAHIQAGLSPAGDRPTIELSNPDSLGGLRVTHDLLADWSDTKTSWDDYVAEILEDGSALSVLAFSAVGRAQGRHLNFQSLAVAPTRLHSHAGGLIEFVDISSGSVTGTEVIARLDITAPMDVDQVALFVEGPEEGREQSTSPGPESRYSGPDFDDDGIETL